jgi:hypothetical protein
MGPRKESTKTGIVFLWNLCIDYEQIDCLYLIRLYKSKEKVARLHTIAHNVNNNKTASDSHVKSLATRVYIALASASDHIISLWRNSGARLYRSIEEGVENRIFAAYAGTTRLSVEAEC